ncbi:MAG: threonine/serine exporter family protein [Oscillospiraceae bacterium]|nr:threonine/serine exporter family protein [Oscillospiraceae bacterium]
MSFSDALLQILMAFFGTIGFGMLFRSRGKKLLLAGLGGMLAWTLFLLLGCWIESEPIRYFIVSVIVSVYAEVLARICKTPAGTFGILSLVPLVPGGGLYYSADYALSGDMGAFVEKALSTLSLTAMLSVGIVLVAAFAKFISSVRRNRG